MSTEEALPQGELLCYLILTQQKILKPFMDSFRDTLSPMQLSVVGLLAAFGPSGMSELAQRLHTTRQQMTQVVARLVEEGFAERAPDGCDRRAVRILATGKARRCLRDGSGAYLQELLCRARALPAGDYEALMAAIATLNRILPLLPDE